MMRFFKLLNLQTALWSIASVAPLMALASNESQTESRPAPDSAGPLIIDVSDYRFSDVNTDPRYPIQDRPALVRVTLHNQGSMDIEDAALTARVDGVLIGETKCEVSAEDSTTVEIPWTPEQNGFQTLAVQARSEDATAETSAEIVVPVVTRQFYFQWYTRDWEEDRHLRWANMVQFRQGNSDFYNYWQKRGFYVYPSLGWKKPSSPESFAKYLEEAAVKYGGIVYDELGAYDNDAFARTAQIRGLKRFLEANPQSFTAIYAMGSLKPTLLNLVRRERYEHAGLVAPEKTGIDLILTQSYLNYQTTSFNSRSRYAYFDQRIQASRDYDTLENTIMILGYAGTEDPEIENRGRGPHFVTKYSLEDQVRYVRRHAPEMPGIGFYGYPSSKEIIDWLEMQTFADELCLKYFVKPVVTIWDRDLHLTPVTPLAGETIELHAALHNIGGMDAPDVRVTFHDGDPRMDGEVIGKPQTIETVFSGKGMPPGMDKIVNAPMPAGRYQVSQEWVPAAGYHEIFVTLEAEPEDVTILDALASRSIYVRD